MPVGAVTNPSGTWEFLREEDGVSLSDSVFRKVAMLAFWSVNIAEMTFAMLECPWSVQSGQVSSRPLNLLKP